MNEMIQNNLFSIILVLLFFIFVLIGLLVYIVVQLLNQKNNRANTAQTEPIPTIEKKLKYPIEEPVVEKFYCINHKETASAGSCLMCEDVFCENCLVEHEGIYFCKDHFRIFANNKWAQISDIKTTPSSPEEGLFVWAFKRKIWKDKNIPSFVLTHYKINVEEDFIESYVQLNVKKEDEIVLKEMLEEFRAN